MHCLLQGDWGFETVSFMAIVFIGLTVWAQNLFKVNTGYGKFLPSATRGFLVSSALAWFIYESPNLIIGFYFLFFKSFPMTIPNLAIFSLFLIHYIHRDLIYPLKLIGNSRKYPLELASTAVFFCTFNGYYQSYSNTHLCSYEDDWIYTWNFSFGIILFALGMFINIRSDNILLKIKKRKLEALKKENKDIQIEASKKIYGIPNEFLFQYVASPNYFGECLEWLGYAIAGWSLNGLVFFLSTFSILLSRAILNKQWYRNNFTEYPKDRKAMVPFII